MTTTTKSSGPRGVGFFGLLTLLFIGLKLGHVIDWNWIWVLSPLWIGIVSVFSIMFGLACLIGLASIGDQIIAARKNEAR